MTLKRPIVFETTFGTYTATHIVGEGGAGRVYRAADENGSTFAVKLLDPSKATRDKIKRFKNEYLFWQRNKHPNLITIVDSGLLKSAKQSSPFYVMPYYEGSLRTLLESRIEPTKAFHYFSQLLDGIEAAHKQRVIHRDLKPENILYNSKTDEILLADFGIAHFEQEDLYTLVDTYPSSRLANFRYAAPEQRARGLEIDHRADIYAVGLILNEMFTNEVPQGTGYKTIESVVAEYAYLDDLVSTMIRQTASERPDSVEVIKGELIGRGQEFVTRQRLSALQQTVIPVTELDDPMLTDPPRIVRVDWDQGQLTLFFQRPVNPKWVQALNNMGSYSSVMGKGPEVFSFAGEKASIPARDHEVQQIIDYFKQWIPLATRRYGETLRREQTETEERHRRQLNAKIEEEARRLRVLSSIKL